MRRDGLMVSVAMVTLACGGTAVAPIDSGLVGEVVRGPITPVCMVDRPCDAPFSAHFTVRSDALPIATFVSDTLGQFLVYLPPGRYVIQPAPDAPILFPQQQSKVVSVGRSGLTSVRLEFDTGIR
jgi:hypothetical protein